MMQRLKGMLRSLRDATSLHLATAYVLRRRYPPQNARLTSPSSEPRMGPPM